MKLMRLKGESGNNESRKETVTGFLIGSVLLLTACGGKKADNTYHDAIAALPENTYSATVDIGLDKPVLLVTDGVYDDGNGNEAAITVMYIIRLEKRFKRSDR